MVPSQGVLPTALASLQTSPSRRASTLRSPYAGYDRGCLARPTEL